MALGINPSTASRNLAGLERAGYILRRRGTDDGRQTDVRLTPRGKRTAEGLSGEWLAVYAGLLERVPRPDRQKVSDVIETLARLLQLEDT